MTDKVANQKNKKNDTMLKLIAVICAVFLWFYAEAQENPSKERQLTVPIQYVNVASDFVVEPASQSVQVTIKGNETDIMSLRNDDFTAIVDLSRAEEGNASYPVQVTGNAVTERFSYTPEHVRISIDRITRKDVPVRVRTDGDIAQNYELQHIDVQPDYVTIRGTSKALAELNSVETNVIDITDLKDDTEVAVLLHLPDEITVQNEDGSITAEKRIMVALHVQALQMENTVETEITLRNVPLGISAELDVTKATLVLQGEAEVVEVQDLLDQISLYVDCTGLMEGQYTLPIQVEIDNDALRDALQSVTPQTVMLMLTSDGTIVSSEGDDTGIEETDMIIHESQID